MEGRRASGRRQPPDGVATLFRAATLSGCSRTPLALQPLTTRYSPLTPTHSNDATARPVEQRMVRGPSCWRVLPVFFRPRYFHRGECEHQASTDGWLAVMV